MEEQEEQGMDTTYLGIMVMVFLVVAALAIDIGYMYVSDDDLKNVAESSAIAGAGAMARQRLDAANAGPDKLRDSLQDQVQQPARNAAIEHASGDHKAAALVEIRNSNNASLSSDNDMTLGFWNISTKSFTSGSTPVNAVHVRARRTAEHESSGFGNLGNILSKITGSQQANYTPEAVAAIPPMADANFAICVDACGAGCTYPNICKIPERKMIQDPWDPRNNLPADNRYAITSLSTPPGDTTSLSNLICMGMTPKEVCGKEIFTSQDKNANSLRDMEAVMYNPNMDKANKDYEKTTGALQGWWVIAPVTDCPPARQDGDFERHRVTKYALIRISRICVPGPTGCSQNNTAFDAPGFQCGNETGLYIDRISCLGCTSPTMAEFPGLHPILVK